MLNRGGEKAGGDRFPAEVVNLLTLFLLLCLPFPFFIPVWRTAVVVNHFCKVYKLSWVMLFDKFKIGLINKL